MSSQDEDHEDYTAFSLSKQHNAETGSFSELSKAFKANPALEHYLELRKSNPGKLIEISTSWALDWCFKNEHRLKELGIDMLDAVGSLDADEASTSRLSLRLIELIVERRAREREGETHLVGRGEAISDSLVNYLIAMMLDALDWNNEMTIPRDLIVLIKHQLNADKSAEHDAMKLANRKEAALSVGGLMIAQGKTVSIAKVAEAMGVQRSTVMRWFKGENYQQKATEWFRMMDGFRKGDWSDVFPNPEKPSE